MMNLSCYKPGKGRTPGNHFAVPDEGFSTGEVTGQKLFLEILEEMKKSGESHACNVKLILEDMGLAAGDKKKGSKSKRGAAWGMSCLMADALLFFAKNANFKPWLEGKLAEAERLNMVFDKREANRNAEFVARMKAAKLAKSSKSVMEVAP